MQPDGKCRSCGAAIRWAVSANTGGRIPLDPQPVEGGNLGVVEWAEHPRPQRDTPVVAVDPVAALTGYRYVTHFATCPNADRHRRK